jgi:RimJ/RimL family protein N-acetyltransferase
MTEIVMGIVDWLKTQINVKSIIASTLKTNPASYRVLEKINYVCLYVGFYIGGGKWKK